MDPHTPRTAIFRPVLDSSLKQHFSLPRCSISCTRYLWWCHLSPIERLAKDTFLIAPRQPALGYQSPNLRKKGKVLLLLTDFYRDSDSQSINAKTKIDHFQIHLFKEVYMINPRKLIFDSDYSETEWLYSLRGVRVLRGGMLKQSNMLLSG